MKKKKTNHTSNITVKLLCVHIKTKNPHRFWYESVLLCHSPVLFIVQVKAGPLTSDIDQYANILDVLCPEYDKETKDYTAIQPHGSKESSKTCCVHNAHF